MGGEGGIKLNLSLFSSDLIKIFEYKMALDSKK